MSAWDKKKVRIAGEDYEGTNVGVIESNERWTEIKLEDGSTLKVKTVTKRVLRIDGKFDQDGMPCYAVYTTNVLDVDAPKDLCEPDSNRLVEEQ